MTTWRDPNSRHCLVTVGPLLWSKIYATSLSVLTSHHHYSPSDADRRHFERGLGGDLIEADDISQFSRCWLLKR